MLETGKDVDLQTHFCTDVCMVGGTNLPPIYFSMLFLLVIYLFKPNTQSDSIKSKTIYPIIIAGSTYLKLAPFTLHIVFLF